jgi:hypothetical protein
MTLAQKIDRRILNALQTSTNRQSESVITQITKTEPTAGIIKSVSGVTAQVSMSDNTEKKCNFGTKVYRPGDSVTIVGTRIL